MGYEFGGGGSPLPEVFNPVALQGPTQIQTDPFTLVVASNPSILQRPTPSSIGQITEVITSAFEFPNQQDGKTQETEGLAEAMIELVGGKEVLTTPRVQGIEEVQDEASTKGTEDSVVKDQGIDVGKDQDVGGV
ncbi:hypothetical protein LWI28_001501 [Acer negundo]|uniref:Uncharacterized protein n=1 Tax=Acer negundo TaxID=4023 RepID=A0AAD5NQG1_ACENE|nr:hypothetical protein LWI28_001501 [Acer negundo]